MSNRTIFLNELTHRYLLDASLREPNIMRRLREETASLPMSAMQIAPEQGQFMALLAQLMGARRCIEVGVFTGYSSLAIARVLPNDGYIVACDMSAEWTAIARRFWKEAGVANRVDLRLGPALETLDALLADGQAESFDFAFIDADKGNYLQYYERLLQLIRPAGLIAVDNVLWGGQVADPVDDSPDTRAIRAFNEHLRADQRVSLSLVPIGDGVTLALKRIPAPL